MKCQVCGTETMMAFRCPFCGGQFCSQHRLPENHKCLGIGQARSQTQARVMTQDGYNNYNYSYVFGQPTQRKYRIRWSQKEVKHIGIAAALVIGIGFSIPLFSRSSWGWPVMSAFALILTMSFLVHEIAHKVYAQKAGMWAEFRLTTWGALITLAAVFLPFKLIAPGAMMIGGNAPTAKDMMKISIAGVITNMIFASTFLGLGLWLAYMFPLNAWAGMLIISAYINALIAVFNLIPFGILDGYKIFMLNKTIWVAAFIPAAVLIAITGWIVLF